MIINEIKGKEKKRKEQIVETGRVAKVVEERVELFVGGSTVEKLEVDGRVVS